MENRYSIPVVAGAVGVAVYLAATLDSAPTTQTALAPPTPPARTAALTSSPSGRVTLAWDKPSDPSVVSYVINFGLSSSTNTTSINVGDTNQFTLTNLFIGSNYTAWAVSQDANGVKSVPSNFLIFTVPAPPPTLVTIRFYSLAIESYGFAGVTNQLQSSTNLVNWVGVTNFVPVPGQLFQHIHVIQTQNFFFRVIKL